MKKCRFETFKKTDDKRSFQDGFDEFIRLCNTRNLSKYTIRYYETLRYVLKCYCCMNDTSINSIDTSFYEDFIIFLKQRNIKDATIVSYTKGFRTVLYYFMDRKYVKRFKVKIPKADIPVKNIYTQAEVETLLKAPDFKNCSFSELRTWAMIVYFIGTGQRLRTVLGLKIEDIDFDNNIVILKNMKNRKQTILPLSLKVAEALKIYLNYRGGTKNDFLFCSWEGLELSKRGAEEAIRRYNKARGIDKTSIHAFRHSFATNYLDCGGDIFRLQKLLCHSNINTTKEYIHLTTKGIGKDLDNLTYLSDMSFGKIKMR